MSFMHNYILKDGHNDDRNTSMPESQCQPSYLASVADNYSSSEELFIYPAYSDTFDQVSSHILWSCWDPVTLSRSALIPCSQSGLVLPILDTGPGHRTLTPLTQVTHQPYSVRRNILEMWSSGPWVKSSLTQAWPRILRSTSRMSNSWRGILKV